MDQAQGWIKLYRKITDSPVWSDPYYLKLWMYCLMKATHKEREVILGNQIVTLIPGQFITGRKSLFNELNEGMKPNQKLSERTWYRYLENLEKWEMLTIKKTNKYSVVSIIKWNDYQETDHQLTNSCPSIDQQLTTNKNVKNVKNVKKEPTTTTENPVQLFEKLLCRLSPNQMETIYRWQDDFGGQAEIINEAIRIADDKNKRYFGFVEYLLKEWANNKLDSLDRVRAYEQEKFNKFKKPNPSNKKAIRTELVPDWFDEDQEKQPKEQPPSADMLAKKKEIEERLKKYKS